MIETSSPPDIQLPRHAGHYRATGIVRGRFIPCDRGRRRGILVTPDAPFPAAVKGPWKAPKDTDERLWNVWVKTAEDEAGLHFQLKGPYRDLESLEPVPPETLDGDLFSIRGNLRWWDAREGRFAIRVRPNGDCIRQFKPFTLVMRGHLPQPRSDSFWEIQATREGSELVLVDGRELYPPMPKRQPRRVRSRSRSLSPPPRAEVSRLRDRRC